VVKVADVSELVFFFFFFFFFLEFEAIDNVRFFLYW
jgi:hypothetical protein